MKKCNYCESIIKDDDGICTFCGYDPKTDTVSPTFKQKSPSVKELKKKKTLGAGGIDPRVKKFAFIGLAVVVFSIFYKYNFNIEGVTSEISYFFSKLKTGKFKVGLFGIKLEKGNSESEWIDISSFEVPQNEIKKKDLVIEGIFFEHDSKGFVVISGKVISEGESFDTITVKKINKDSVEVIVDGQSKLIGLNQSIPLPTEK